MLVLHTTGCEGGGGVGSLFFCLLLHMYTAIRMRRRRTSRAPIEEPKMSPERDVEEAVVTGGGGETSLNHFGLMTIYNISRKESPGSQN